MSAEMHRAFHCSNETRSARNAAAIYDALLAQRGVVPNMFKVSGVLSGHRPGVAGFLKPLLSDGALTGWYKELVAVRISHPDEFGVRHHRAPSLCAEKRRQRSRSIAGVADFENGPLQRERKTWASALPTACIVAHSTSTMTFYTELKSSISTIRNSSNYSLPPAAFEMFPRFIDGLRIPVTPLPAAK